MLATKILSIREKNVNFQTSISRWRIIFQRIEIDKRMG